MKFTQMQYTRPDMKQTLAGYAEICTQIQAAASGAAVVKAFESFMQLSDTVATAAELANIRHTQNVNDAFYEKEKDFFDENAPHMADAQLNVYRAALASPHKAALADKYGQILLDKMAIDVKSQSEEILPLMAEENALITAYEKLYASAQIDFDGKKLTVSQMSLYKQSPDAAVRRAAYEAEGTWWDAHRAQLDDIYDKMVQNRTQQAKALGFDSYTQLGYIRMHRLGYSMDEISAYRTQIVQAIVPLAEKCKAAQAKRIGVDTLKFYDDSFVFADGNAMPKGTPDEILAAGKKMYTELSVETAAFIRDMFDGELFDVLSRNGKAPGGYCTYIPNYKAPFIFSNFNATADDVDVLTHEAGHAFAAAVAADKQLPAVLREPGMESCEIHSMSMEFLTAPYHHLFFGEDTAKYEYAHAADAVCFLPYGTMVDEFQHIVYDNPTLTPDERNAAWAQLEKKYRPWLHFDNLPFYGRGAGWQRQLHIYECPFYYIDYCLAQTVALQFFTAHLQNAQDAWQRYLALVNKAGTCTYTQLVESAGFASPFVPGTLQHIAAQLDAWFTHNEVR